MRFVVLTQFYPPEIGAPQTRLAAVVRHLLRHGHEVEVVTALPNYPTGRIAAEYRRKAYIRETDGRAIVHRVWVYAAMGRGMARLLNYLSFCAACVLGLARCRRPNVVFVESPPLFAVVPGQIAARLWRARSIMNVADLWPDAAVDLGAVSDGPALRAARWLERRSYARADVVNGATEGLVEAIRARTDEPDKVLLFPNGVDTEAFDPARADPERLRILGLPENNLFIHAGTMSYIHGLENVVRAFADVPHLTLALIGAGSHQLELEALARELGARNVRFVPPIPLTELATILPLAKAAVVSVRDIPQATSVRPAKLFPAMASALPIVYAGRGEGAELVRDARCGIVVDNDDPAAIVSALDQIVTCDEPLGRNGREWVEANMSWDQIVVTWLTEIGQRFDLDS